MSLLFSSLLVGCYLWLTSVIKSDWSLYVMEKARNTWALMQCAQGFPLHFSVVLLTLPSSHCQNGLHRSRTAAISTQGSCFLLHFKGTVQFGFHNYQANDPKYFHFNWVFYEHRDQENTTHWVSLYWIRAKDNHAAYLAVTPVASRGKKSQCDQNDKMERILNRQGAPK